MRRQKMSLIALLMLSTMFLTGLKGCPKDAPKQPVVDDCTYSWEFQKFRCLSAESGKHENRPLSSPRMKNARCTTADGADEIQNWIDALIKWGYAKLNSADQNARE